MERVENLEDVIRFFRYLYEERSVAFHPDDKFEVYVNNITGEQTFTPKECEKFDGLMDECFTLCDKVGVDIYQTASDMLKL